MYEKIGNYFWDNPIALCMCLCICYVCLCMYVTEWCACICMMFMCACIGWLMAGLRREYFLLPVEVTRRMLILPNYRLKLLERQWYIFHVNPLALIDVLLTTTFYYLFTIPYVTLIIIHVGWIKYWSNSFYSTRTLNMLKCPYVSSLTDRVE